METFSLVVCADSVLTGSQTVEMKTAAERETLRSEADKHPLKTTENFQPPATPHQLC